MTDEFLEFSKEGGNDLSTPQPSSGFPGLAAGDRWCLCASRWKEAFDAGVAPPVFLAATHASVLEWVELGELRQHATSDTAGRYRGEPVAWTDLCGDVAQLARAPALQAGSRGFESRRLH